MKIIIISIFLSLLTFANIFSQVVTKPQILRIDTNHVDYGGNAHDYIVDQANKFLFYKLGYSYDGIVNNLWTIRNGDVNEDNVDLVYGYDGIFGWGRTVTHFWDPDATDWETNDFTWPYVNIPNAYTKVQKFLNGDYDLNIQDGNIAHQFKYPGNGVDCGLINYYKTGYVKCTYHGWENHSLALRTQVSYLILGHVCHLLQDMSSPAHVHIAEHRNVDCLEHFAENYSRPDYKQAGIFIDPLGTWYGEDPIRGLFYTAAQLADLYPSNSVGTPDDCGCCGYNHDGDNSFTNTGGSIPYTLWWFYYRFFPYSWSQNPNWVVQKDNLVAYSINATASLLYWFANKAGLNKVYAPAITGLTSNMVGDLHYGLQLYKGQIGTVYPMTQGSNLQYAWHYYECDSPQEGVGWPFSIHGVESYTSHTSPIFSLFNINFDGLSCFSNVSPIPSSATIQGRLELYNYDHQYAVFSDRFIVKPLMNEIPGGCPYIFVLGNDTSGGSYFVENNILHKSEIYENIGNNISDYYLLKTVPKLDSGKILIQIKEIENDVNYFDQVKLFAVDHPVGTKIGITENNDIVLYYTDNVSSSDNAIKNTPNNNITDFVQYGQQISKVKGFNDYINAHFDSTSQKLKYQLFAERLKKSNKMLTIDSLAIVSQVCSNMDNINPVAKDWAGNFTIYTNSDVYTKQFSKRILTSDIITPFSFTSDNVDYIAVNFSSDYAMSYLSVVPISYYGFSQTEMPLNEAVHTLHGDVYSLMVSADNNTVMLDTTSKISLKFDYVAPSDPLMLRDYVFFIKGRYVVNSNLLKLAQNNIKTSIKDKENSTIEFKLYDNYPNPFNPTTKISFEIGKSGLIRLDIYDVLGRLIKTLVNEIKTPGKYTVEFNGVNLSSGIYFYKLQSSDNVDIKRMILIK